MTRSDHGSVGRALLRRWLNELSCPEQLSSRDSSKFPKRRTSTAPRALALGLVGVAPSKGPTPVRKFLNREASGLRPNAHSQSCRSYSLGRGGRFLGVGLRS